jgi:two-component system NarL family response regulator
MTILLVDDHTLFADGLKNLLEAEGLPVAGIVRDGAEAVLAARRLKPDIILMDIDMPGCDGLTATRLIKAEFPEIKIVMLTVSADEDSLFEAVRSGASGYLLKNLDAEEFFACLERLGQEEAVFSPGLADRLLREFTRASQEKKTERKQSNPLTSRQEEILTLIARGVTYKKVAEKLGVTERTVKYHMNEILERLHLDNRAQAIAYLAETQKERRFDLPPSPRPDERGK